MISQPGFDAAVDELKRLGILLESDPRLPSLASLVAGARISGSWWAHPKAHEIYAAAVKLRARPDTVTAKLVSGKVTYVHRNLWPALLGISTAKDPWQISSLSPAAHSLLASVEQGGVWSTARVPDSSEGKAGRAAARELEDRLLIQSESVHTPSGAHAKALQSWRRWADRVGFSWNEKMESRAAREMLEELLSDINLRYRARGRLPWASR